MKLPALRLRPAQPATIHLDFIAQRRRPGALGWLLLGAGLLAAVSMLLEYQGLGEQLEVAQARLARETRHYERSRNVALSRQREKLPETELARAAALADSLRSHPLTGLAEIEAAGNADITLLSLSKTAAKPLLRLTGEARSLDAAFAYAKRLAARPGVRSARIETYEFKQEGSVEAVAFTLQAIVGGAQ